MSIGEEVLFNSLPAVMTEELTIRRATPRDVDAVLRIASSVGKNKKDSTQGFLMDDYTKNREHHRKKFFKAAKELDYFYIAERNGFPVGFLMAYTKEQWLDKNPNWLFETHWIPTFDKSRLKKFILIDKTAVRASLTGKGIGSALYNVLIQDMKKSGLRDIFSETVIAPKPNIASLEFRKKQNYRLVGTRFEEHNSDILTDLVYHKLI